jgi:hypothetical protein
LRKIACFTSGDVCDHAGNAAAAASIARRASSRPPDVTRATTSPLKGSASSYVSPGASAAPPMKWPCSWIWAVVVAIDSPFAGGHPGPYDPTCPTVKTVFE